MGAPTQKRMKRRSTTWLLQGWTMLHQHRSEPEFAHAAAANEIADGHPGTPFGTTSAATHDADRIMEALLRDYLRYAPQLTELATWAAVDARD